MRIQKLSCNPYNNQQANPSFGFDYPAMWRPWESASKGAGHNIEQKANDIIQVYKDLFVVNKDIPIVTAIIKQGKIWLMGKKAKDINTEDICDLRTLSKNVKGSPQPATRRSFDIKDNNGNITEHWLQYEIEGKNGANLVTQRYKYTYDNNKRKVVSKETFNEII